MDFLGAALGISTCIPTLSGITEALIYGGESIPNRYLYVVVALWNNETAVGNIENTEK